MNEDIMSWNRDSVALLENSVPAKLDGVCARSYLIHNEDGAIHNVINRRRSD